MREAQLLHELVLLGAERSPDAPALTHGRETLGYGALAATVQAAAGGLAGLGVGRAERVAVYLEKRFEMVVACFAAPAMGGVFVPVNPLLKPEQVAFILRDCDVRVLVTSAERLKALAPGLAACPALRHVVLVDAVERGESLDYPDAAPRIAAYLEAQARQHAIREYLLRLTERYPVRGFEFIPVTS